MLSRPHDSQVPSELQSQSRDPTHSTSRRSHTPYVKEIYSLALSLYSELNASPRFCSRLRREQLQNWKSQRGRFMIWGQDLEIQASKLDESFLAEQDSRLRKTILYLLSSETGSLLICFYATQADEKAYLQSFVELLDSLCKDVGDEEWTTKVMQLAEEVDDIRISFSDQVDEEWGQIEELLEDTFDDIKSTNNCLFDLLPLIQQHLREVETKNVHVGITTFIVNIEDKFKLISSEFATRLAELNWQRHIRIRQNMVRAEEARHLKLIQKANSEKDSGLGSSIDTSAPSIHAEEAPLDNTSDPAPEDDAETVVTTTSFGTIASRFSGRTWIPLPPVKLDGSKCTFECSVCFNPVTISTNREWKKHILRDLQPYSCSSDCCADKKRTYASRNEWVNHEFECHRQALSLIWPCYECEEVEFPDKTTLSFHIASQHPESSIQQTPNPAKTQCPFCEETISQTRNDIKLHMGRHFDEIALKALPHGLGQDDEDNEHESEADDEQLRSEADDKELESEADDEELESEADNSLNLGGGSTNSERGGKKDGIKFRDAVQRTFSFPWELCAKWEQMETLIKQAFRDDEILRPRVEAGHYDLIGCPGGADGVIILPAVWDSVIEPGWSISMHMWPLPEEAEPEPEVTDDNSSDQARAIDQETRELGKAVNAFIEKWLTFSIFIKTETPWTCTLCCMTFKKKLDAIRHYTKVHLSKRAYICNDDPEVLQSVLGESYNGTAGCRWVAGGCGRGFERKEHYRKHLNCKRKEDRVSGHRRSAHPDSIDYRALWLGTS
ncbi:hypothetical protein BJ508DRAFT_419099 [Ascobolus immersus RN42]|uniref:C2H2-type domain-containing protein n=1 Tax=Ascobolus immersus RN42 TaxID=1160509 RepID=A0A3N4HL88_ASCIM|nr:hypothetical protein BJ508DRAFT_419099 [Ascobolus immersus RN42]